MLIQQTFSWASVNWPSSSPATEYTVFQIYPGTTPTVVVTPNTNSVTLSFDDSQSIAYQVRPSAAGPIYGPEASVIVIGYVPCRAWLRQSIRLTLADRVDVDTSIAATWPDDEINNNILESINEFNILFPYEKDTVIPLAGPTIENGITVGVRNYPLPLDFYTLNTVEYVTPDGKLNLYLKEKPWKGGETTATSYLGYPKLGILLSPLAGRYFPGHYEVWENQIWVDFDPPGNGDVLKVRYKGKRPLPMNDGDILSFTPEDLNIISLGAQMKCALRLEVQDARLSRWRGKEDGVGNRADMPTLKHWIEIKKLYDQRVNDRRELRPKVRRLVRR
ncbi:MAG: hypothetical protein ACJ788_00135 [Ktedonobacteraceae bacterium]